MREPFRVGRGRESLLVSPVRNNAGQEMWRFRYVGPGGKDKAVRRKSRSEIRGLALDYLRAKQAGLEELESLTASHKETVLSVLRHLPTERDLDEFLAWRNQRKSALKIGEIVERYIDYKRQGKGFITNHLRSVQKDLESLEAKFPGIIFSDLSTDDLVSWHGKRVGSAGPKRRNDCRANLVGLYRWAKLMGEITSDGVLLAQRLPIAAEERKALIRYAARNETLFLLRNVSESFRLWMVLGLFSGMRPEEIIPEKGRRRRGIDRQEIDIETRTIYVSREVAGKQGPARRIPISDCLEAWLKWAGWRAGQIGPVGTKTAARAEETKRLGVLLDEEHGKQEGWPKDYLRHTYASHRNAVLQSLHALAQEMGNSESILKKHYNQPLPRKEGEEFFMLRPRDLEEKVIVEGNFAS